jgi:hypothetical protein
VQGAGRGDAAEGAEPRLLACGVAVTLDRDETADYVAICRLQSAYADVVNRRAWPELEPLFVAGALVTVDTVTNPVVEVAGAEQMGSFIAGAIERFEFFEFVRLNTVVWFDDDDRARGRLFMCELRQERVNGYFSRALGVYHDEYQRVDGRWCFARRRYQSLARTGRGEVFMFPDVPGFD